ncbi:hypothetical protein BC831DRAFT_446280, partial [Entophlyctis helioformis]
MDDDSQQLHDQDDHRRYSPFLSRLSAPLPAFLDSIATFPLASVFAASFEARLESLQLLLLDETAPSLPLVAATPGQATPSIAAWTMRCLTLSICSCPSTLSAWCRTLVD